MRGVGTRSELQASGCHKPVHTGIFKVHYTSSCRKPCVHDGCVSVWSLEHCGGTGPAAGGGHPCPGMRLCPELGFPGMRGASGIGTDTLSSSHPGPFRVLGGGRVKVLGAMGPARASPLLWAQRPARGGDTFPGPPHTWRRRRPGFLPGLIWEPRSWSTAQVGPKLEKPGLK